MEIIEITKQKNKYKIKFFVHDSFESLLFFEEVLIELGIMKPGNISLEQYEEMIELNHFYEGFYEGVKYLKLEHTKSELEEHLRKKGLYNKKIIKKLEDLKLVDDKNFGKKYLESLKNKGKGKKYVEKKFIEKKLPLSLIDYSYDEEIEIINKMILQFNRKRNNLHCSNQMAKFKLKSELINAGFSMEVIDECLMKVKFNNDDSINLKRDLEVALKKYPNVLEKQINYLLRKGYFYEDIKRIIGGVEYD